MTHPVILAGAAAVLILCSGCQQYREAQQQKAYNEKRETALRNGWIPARQPVCEESAPQVQPNETRVVSAAPPIMPPPIILQSAQPTPTQSRAPQPIIFTGAGQGTTIAQQVGNSTIVSQFGGRGGSGTTIAQQVGDSTIVSQFGSAGRGTTVAQQFGDTTIVSQFGGGPPIGGYRPAYSPPAGVYGFGE